MTQDDTSCYFTSDNSPRAHRLVAQSAKEYCAELYDLYARKIPSFREQWPSQNAFVRRFWFYFIAEARTNLARLLAQPIDDSLKREIHEALIKDTSLQPTRAGLDQVRMDI